MDKSSVMSAPVLGGKVIKQPNKLIKVKNKTAADLQITAEQLLREAKERQLEIVPAPPKQKIQDQTELLDYQRRKRKEYEDQLRKNRTFIGNWMKYAAWEEKQMQLERTRSIYERALDVDHRNITLWIKYAEMEMRNKQVNHARNLWDRAVTILPRVNQFWYKYTYMEEMLENVAGCRRIFERWLEWEPEEQAWLTFIKFELRYKELDRARSIYERFIFVHPEIKNWIRFAKFEERNNFVQSGRGVYERAVEFFSLEHCDEHLFVAFARFEEGQKEFERARTIYRYALDTLPKEKTAELQKAYTIHEKKHGKRSGIESVISEKRRAQYEAEIEQDPTNYDAWFDLIRLVTTRAVDEDEVASSQSFDKVRAIYERAIANIPPAGTSKQYWRRYIYLWIQYAVFEELKAKDIDRTRQVYKTCLDILPHKQFTFAKVWLLYAQFEIRRKDVKTARQALGTALGKCPKAKLFRGYIELEIRLREFERCRKLYEKFIFFEPAKAPAWIKFAELEALLGDWSRARSIYELAINQPAMDMPELIWKAYIDFEVEQDDRDDDGADREEGSLVRQLYRRLLSKTSHVKVWLAFAQYETSLADKHADNDSQAVSLAIGRARTIYKEANDSLRRAMAEAERQIDITANEIRDFDEDHYEDAFAGDEARARLHERLAFAESRLAETKDRRIAFMDKWLAFERSQLEDTNVTETESDELNAVLRLMPTRLKKRRQIKSAGSGLASSGSGGLWEEYFDYLFPEDESAKPNLKLLAMAKQWKQRDTNAKSSTEDEDESDDDEADENSEEEDEPEEEGGESVRANRGADDSAVRDESSGSDESDE